MSESTTKIWIDADSCPTLVRNHVTKIAEKMNINVYFVANKEIKSENKYQMIICENTKDAADNSIFEHVQSKDLVITRDIVFADRLVSKKITTINIRNITIINFSSDFKKTIG
mgnify:CR=1 FL=1